MASVLKRDNNLNFIGHLKDYRPSKDTRYILLHRPIYSLSLEFLIRRLKRKNIKIIADVDDLIIHPDFTAVSPAVVNKILDEKVVAKRFLKNYKALNLCDHLICSTLPLEKILKEYFVNKKVTVLHNCIFNTWKYDLDSYFDDKKIITYFPGTKSHDNDFSFIKRPLEAFLKDTKDVKLKIVGPLEFSLDISDTQLSYLPKVPFKAYGKIVQQSSINLAPLESSIFNSCKSALKAIEAGAFGIPTIFSPNEDAERFKDDSVFIAKTETDWYDTLRELFSKDNFDKAKCYEAIKSQSDINKVSIKFYEDVLDNV